MSDGSLPTLPTADQLRSEVRNWLRDNWTSLPRNVDPWTSSPERIAWLEKVLDAGFAVPTYPSDWFGRGYPADLANIIAQEFAAAKAPGSRQDKYNIAAVQAWNPTTMATLCELIYALPSCVEEPPKKTRK